MYLADTRFSAATGALLALLTLQSAAATADTDVVLLIEGEKVSG